MALELIYTSVPRGLEPGRTGFCTVAMTRGMSPQMVKILEGLVAYTPVFEHYDPNSAYNPASIFHYPVSDGRNRFELLARVCSCGLDYTKRSNKIGHFILLSEAEKANAANGPTSLLADPQLFINEWHGEPQYFTTERPLNNQETASAKAYAWEQATGDAGWAAWLAESYMANPDKPCFVVFDPLQHTNLQALVAESLMLLPKRKRWSVTWNTYMTAISAGLLTCNWRFCTANPAVMSAIGCVSGANILDLRQSLGSAGESPLRQCARMGSDLYPETTERMVSTPEVPTSSSSSEGPSLVAMMQKRLEEQKAEELAELSSNKSKLRLKNLDEPAQQGVPYGGYPVNGGYQVNGGYPANSGTSNNYMLWLIIVALQFIIIAGLVVFIVREKSEKQTIIVQMERQINQLQKQIEKKGSTEKPMENQPEQSQSNEQCRSVFASDIEKTDNGQCADNTMSDFEKTGSEKHGSKPAPEFGKAGESNGLQPPLPPENRRSDKTNEKPSEGTLPSLPGDMNGRRPGESEDLQPPLPPENGRSDKTNEKPSEGALPSLPGDMNGRRPGESEDLQSPLPPENGRLNGEGRSGRRGHGKQKKLEDSLKSHIRQ